MGKIFQGQTNLAIDVTVDQDITGATPVLIKFIKPSKKEGSFIATIIDAAAGIIQYIIASANDLDEYGDWTFWAHITFSNGKEAAGEPFTEKIYEEGEIC